MSDVSFLTTVKTKSFFHTVFLFFSSKLTIFPLSEIEFLGSSLEEPFGVLEDDNELVLLKELVKVLEGELLELEGLEESFLFGFLIFPEFLDSRQDSSFYIQWMLSAS